MNNIDKYIIDYACVIRYHEGDTTTLSHMYSQLTPAHYQGKKFAADMTPRFMTADALDDAGRHHEAELMRTPADDHGNLIHLYRDESGIHSASDIVQEIKSSQPGAYQTNLSKLPQDEQQYLGSALWSSTDEHGALLDREYSTHDIHPNSIANMLADYRHFKYENNLDNTIHYMPMTGHRFWLSRSHQGSGFFDNEHDYYPGEADRLQKESHRYGEANLYVGDDGLLHTE